MFKHSWHSSFLATCGLALAASSAAAAQPRYPVLVYGFDNAFSFTGVTLTTTHILDDLGFGAGPYGPSFGEPRELSGLTFAYTVSGGIPTADFRVSLYRPLDLNWAGFAAPGSPLLNPTAQPYYVLTLSPFDSNTCPGFTSFGPITFFPTPLSIPSGDDGVVIDIAAVKAGTPASAPLNSTTLAGSTGTSHVGFFFAPSSKLSVGTSSQYIGRDNNYDGVFAASERSTNGGISGPAQAVVMLYGNVNAPTPPASTDLSAAIQSTIGNASYTGTLTPASPVAWYKLSLPAGVSFNANTYLDIDTEGSASPVGMTLYSINSTPFAYGISRGSGPDTPPSFAGLNAFQMSFGLPARPGIGNGDRYSGQEGDLPAGDYYLAVYDASNFASDAWSIGGGPALAASVAYTLNFATNLGNPSVLPPVLSPLVDWDFGIPSASQTSASIPVSARQVSWARFTLTNPIPLTGQFAQNSGNPLADVTYLDITQPGSSITGEWNFALYNSAGNIAGANSISYAGAGFNGNNGGGDGPSGCGGSFAQLSYGTEPSRGTAPLDPGLTTLGKPLNNQNGAALAPDQYYLAVSTGDANFKPSRFGARSTRGTSVSASITIATNNRTPGPGCPADFNGDGGVDDTDFGFFALAYNNLTDLVGDLNSDTLSDDADFAIFAAAYDSLLCP